MNTTHALDWFVITVRPGMERATCAAVRRIGWTPFLPGYRKVVPRSGKVRGAKPGGKVERLFVSWPGYLWVGAPGWLQRTYGWPELLELKLVTGVIMGRRQAEDGGWEIWPLRLPSRWREREEVLRNAENIAFREAVVGDAPSVDYAAGDDVLLLMPGFWFQRRAKCVFLDEEVEGQDDKARRAKVVMSWFGAERETVIPATDAMRHDDSPRPHVVTVQAFEIGDMVEITSGPFKGFCGPIDAIDDARLTVTADILGRKTPVACEASQLKRSRGVPVDGAARRSPALSPGRS